MWIDTRGSDIKVYETQPADPFVKKMTWDPRERAWVLYDTHEYLSSTPPR